jgi:hypothetical protein
VAVDLGQLVGSEVELIERKEYIADDGKVYVVYLARGSAPGARHGRRRSKFKHLVNTYLNYFAPGNILDTILRSFNGAQMRVAEFSSLSADLVLRPLSLDGRWHDFRRPGKYIAIGRREAEEHIDEIKALVHRKESTYETATAHHSLAPVT